MSGRDPGDWDLDRIVASLRAQRAARGAPAGAHALPSREALRGIVQSLRAALFPAHFGPADLAEEGTDWFVGNTLHAALRALSEQVRRAAVFASGGGGGGEGAEERAAEVTRAFAAALPRVRELLETDVRAAFEGDPAAKSLDETLFCYPGVTAITHHRLAHVLYGLGDTLLARIVSEIAHEATGVDIHPGARVGAGFFIDHGTGVVIGETSEIGERVRLYQGVTLGAKRFALDERGLPIKSGARHPIVEDDVVVYAGATVLGRITIGRGSIIGGNVWLTRSVPPGSRVSQSNAPCDVALSGSGK
jgi:serine O-acetyltransferase